jgi:hypothetical protein
MESSMNKYAATVDIKIGTTAKIKETRQFA